MKLDAFDALAGLDYRSAVPVDAAGFEYLRGILVEEGGDE